jgi:hypothetical protein
LYIYVAEVCEGEYGLWLLAACQSH